MSVTATTITTIQRPLKGSRISTIYPVKTLPPLSSLDSAFQLQEYISLLIRRDVHDVDAIVSIPGRGHTKDGSEDSDKGEEGKTEVQVDEACWIYEQLRRIAQDLSHPLITMLQQECTRESCPEMKAGEWLYLCVAHGNDGAMQPCCAIDYILHTLDGATALLNSPRAFPSRLSIPTASHRHFSSLARRLSRIFAHAYFHHRAIFLQAEAESALYARFLALTARFRLVPAEFLVVPPRFAVYVRGPGESGDPEPDEAEEAEPPRVLGVSVDLHQPYVRQERDVDEGHAWMLGRREPSEGEARDPSPQGPRRMGRSRTDTMVHSEVTSVLEELGRGDPEQTMPVEEPILLEAPALEEVPIVEPEASQLLAHHEPAPVAEVEHELDISAGVVEEPVLIELADPDPTPIAEEEPEVHPARESAPSPEPPRGEDLLTDDARNEGASEETSETLPASGDAHLGAEESEAEQRTEEPQPQPETADEASEREVEPTAEVEEKEEPEALISEAPAEEPVAPQPEPEVEEHTAEETGDAHLASDAEPPNALTEAVPEGEDKPEDEEA